MNETPSDLKFLDSHEWIKEDENTVIVGISDHAQSAVSYTHLTLPTTLQV